MAECEGGRLLACSRLLPYKFLGDYLSFGLDSTMRCAVLLHHYRMVAIRFPRLTLATGPDGYLLWSMIHDGLRHEVRVTLSNLTFMEGEWTIEYRLGGRALYFMTVTLAPGHLDRRQEETVLIIGGSQGGIDATCGAHSVAKSPLLMNPANALFVVMLALADCVDATVILGIAVAGKFRNLTPEKSRQLLNVYDHLWISFGGTARGETYSIPVDAEPRPLSMISAHHRARARKRRAARQWFAEEIQAGWRSTMGR